MKSITALFLFTILAATTSAETPPKGMVWIPGGTFQMGSPESDKLAYPTEKPRHEVTLKGFWMDETEVTNLQFKQFVDATAYVTTAEKDIDWEEMKKQVPPGTPKPPAEALKAGSLVFTPPSHPVSLRNVGAWWKWTTGASWKHPEGPGSDIKDRMNHPVVHISWDDATAYAKWARKRLPSEAEWEFAARGGLKDAIFTWGNEPFSSTNPQANIWHGSFPHQNTEEDGFARTAPVKSFPANGYGLYDMSGNVWEWCADWYSVDIYASRVESGHTVVNPDGPSSYHDPSNPHELRRVTRGGSFLCHDSWCSAYRSAGRRGTAYDTGLSHNGFRCVKDGPAPKQ